MTQEQVDSLFKFLYDVIRAYTKVGATKADIPDAVYSRKTVKNDVLTKGLITTSVNLVLNSVLNGMRLPESASTTYHEKFLSILISTHTKASKSAASSAEPAAVVAEQPAQQVEIAPENAQAPAAVVAEQPAQQPEAAPENAQAPSAVVVEQSAQQPEAAPVIAPEPVQPATTRPVSRESGAYARQNLVLERANTSHAQVVLIGDSITEGWEGAPDQLQSLVGLRSAANLGVGGDRTQHVLWRLQQAPLMSVNPKVIVLMIGTNNIYDDSADDIVAGIRAITALLNQQCPNAEILVLDIPPRGDPMDSARAKIAQINAELAQGEWPGHARFVRVGNQFLGADGALDRANLPDLLHFSQKGYAMWAAAIKPELDCSLAANHPQPAPTTPHP